MPLVWSCGVLFCCAAAGGHHARARRAPRPRPGPQCAPGNPARPGSGAHRPRRPAGSRRAPGRRGAAARCHRACSSRPPGPPPASARHGRTRARGPGRDHPRGGHSPGPPPGLRTRQRPPLTPIAPPAPAYRRRCRSSRVRVHRVIRASPVTSAPPSGAWQGGSHGAAPAVSRACAVPGEPAGPLPAAGASGRSARSMTRREVSPGRGRSWAEPAAAAAPAWPARRRVPGPAGLAWSRAAGRGFAGHGSASRPVCRPGWSSAERSAGAGSGGVYAVSRSVAVRQACSTARSRAATRVSRAAMAWRLRRP